MSTQPTLTPLRAIRTKCLDCSGNFYKSVKECPITKCPLYPYRMGKRAQRNNSSGKDDTTENVEIAHQFLANDSTQERF